MTDTRLGRHLPEFVERTVENAYRRSTLPDAIRLARPVLWIGGAMILVFGINDVRLFGWSSLTLQMLGLRLAIAAFSGWLLWRLRRPIEPPRFDRAMLAWAVAIQLFNALSTVTRPPDFVAHLLVLQAILFGMLVFMPLRIRERLVTAFGGAVAVVVLMALLVPGTTFGPLLPALLLTGAMGVALIFQLERLRRQEYARLLEVQAARDAAERADRAKGRFLATVSHEIRTPMNGVLGMLQLLDAAMLDPGQRRHVSIARDSAESLTGLLDAIIDYARLDTEVDRPAPVDFAPTALLEATVELMRPRASAKGLTLDLRIAQPLPAVLRADAGRLRQVVINLLSNAVKFTDAGGITVTASATGSTLRIEVADTGIGIADQVRERIFEAFVQGDDGIARRYGGTGLGLAVCRRIVDILGGSISVTSTPGQGSVFGVSIPVEPGVVSAAAHDPAAPDRRLEVLVVEDDPVNQLVAAGLLAQLGHSATVADDGGSALALLAGTGFDVVLMDLHMPGLDGIATTQHLRELPDARRAAVPVVAVTADLAAASDPRLSDLGFAAIVTKPVRRDVLDRALRQASGQPDADRGAPEPTRLAIDRPLDVRHAIEQAEVLGIRAAGGLYRLFRRTGRSALVAIADSARRGDYQAVELLAHRLASSSATLGFGQLQTMAEQLERAAAEDRPDDVTALASALPAAFDGAYDALRHMARTAKTGSPPDPQTGQRAEATAASSR